jgi:hypothetical protein
LSDLKLGYEILQQRAIQEWRSRRDLRKGIASRKVD